MKFCDSEWNGVGSPEILTVIGGPEHDELSQVYSHLSSCHVGSHVPTCRLTQPTRSHSPLPTLSSGLPRSLATVQRYQKCFYELQEIFITDVLLLNFVSRAKYPTNDQRQMVVSGQTLTGTSQEFDTTELVELLQQSAVEHLTAFRELEARQFSCVFGIVTTDFEALYAYKCGEYQRCLRLSKQNVLSLTSVEGTSRSQVSTLIGDTISGLSCLFVYPEFIQLMDDDIVSLLGLTLIVNPSCRKYHGDDYASVHQLILSLYLMTQCQMKLHQPVTSLAQTLDYVEFVRHQRLHEKHTLHQLLLKLTERRILMYIRRDGEV